jgi:hypothetical protein
LPRDGRGGARCRNLHERAFRFRKKPIPCVISRSEQGAPY